MTNSLDIKITFARIAVTLYWNGTSSEEAICANILLK